MSPLFKTVAVLGASYGGSSAARVLAQGLPKGWRVVLIDRNTHMNHLYVFPRYTVLPGHEHKAFIPYSGLFSSETQEPSPHAILHAHVTSISPHALTLSRAFPEHGIQEPGRTLDFQYLVYALGSHLPAPIDLWNPTNTPAVQSGGVTGLDSNGALSKQGTKAEGIQWFKRCQTRFEHINSILVVGGGALGIQYASDVAEVYPGKRVTLLHSRTKLLPRFDDAMHTEIMSGLTALNVDVILGDRLDLSSVSAGKTVRIGAGGEERVVRTESGREIHAELVLLCTGQKPNTELLATLSPDVIVPEGPSKGMARVTRTLQIAVPAPQSDLNNSRARGDITDAGDYSTLRVLCPHIFAIGDAADAFGDIKAGHNARAQGELAARNILKMIQHPEVGTNSVSSGSYESQSKGLQLERYVPGLPGIKVTLGLKKAVYQRRGVVVSSNERSVDLDALRMWGNFGMDVNDSDPTLYE